MPIESANVLNVSDMNSLCSKNGIKGTSTLNRNQLIHASDPPQWTSARFLLIFG
jgi:hypothetical protein